MSDLTGGLAAWGVAPRSHSHRDVSAPVHPLRQASPVAGPAAPFAGGGFPGSGPMVSFARTGLNVRWGTNVPEPARACRGVRRARAMVMSDGASATPARRALWQGRSATARTRSNAPADGNVLICCSQPEGDVVIDL